MTSDLRVFVAALCVGAGWVSISAGVVGSILYVAMQFFDHFYAVQPAVDLGPYKMALVVLFVFGAVIGSVGLYLGRDI